ncbi:dephospho-CoA kinase [Yoonia sp. R2331]|uniref:dephospho-CoA kinase n=1 Tax=Yoonia sp. R2331 TaxID=3237238 RepID=UPI0034E3B4CB
MSFVLGLTGSIGMGKSTTAQMFAEAGVPVWDADAAVHQLYAPGGAAVEVVAELFPDAIDDDQVSRPKLRQRIVDDPKALDRLQDKVHPLVARDRAAFLAAQAADIVLLDIPLLFESGAEGLCDAIVVVSVDAQTQKARVMGRGEMTEAAFNMIRDRQMPDADKRARADYIIQTDTMDGARQAVQSIIADIRGKLNA